MLKLKASKVKKLESGSTKDKSVKLKEIKELKEGKPKKVVVVSVKGGSLLGAAFKMTGPDGKATKGKVDGSGKISAVLEKEGDSKLDFTSLTDDLKKAR
ncbi:MAG TPA: hypothetical protein VND93_20750 [Myxococcales bacterium]|jgi:hypothetical protein|nr:hypothetical protein [Myxococcales bacterium]